MLRPCAGARFERWKDDAARCLRDALDARAAYTLLTLIYPDKPRAGPPQKEEAAAKKAGAAAAEDAQKAIADMMVQAQAQMAQETGAVRGRGGGLHLRPARQGVGAWRTM